MFRHNYVTLLYESGFDALIAMKIVGYTDYQTAASIYTHLKEATLRRASINMEKILPISLEKMGNNRKRL